MVHRSADIKQLTYVITCIIAGQKRCKLWKNSTKYTTWHISDIKARTGKKTVLVTMRFVQAFWQNLT